MFNVNLKHDDIIMLCNKFRNLLYKNSQKNNDIEIKPKQVLEFLLERLNKEQRKNRNGPSFKNLPKILTKIKLKAFEEFKENFNKNYQSDITDHFILYMKKKRVCKKYFCSYVLAFVIFFFHYEKSSCVFEEFYKT